MFRPTRSSERRPSLRAKRSNPDFFRRQMDCFACARNDVRDRDTPSRSRGAMRPRFFKIFAPPRTEGAGKAGCPMHPRPRVVCSKHAR
jgi:hypothetical protein